MVPWSTIGPADWMDEILPMRCGFVLRDVALAFPTNWTPFNKTTYLLKYLRASMDLALRRLALVLVPAVPLFFRTGHGRTDSVCSHHRRTEKLLRLEIVTPSYSPASSHRTPLARHCAPLIDIVIDRSISPYLLLSPMCAALCLPSMRRTLSFVCAVILLDSLQT